VPIDPAALHQHVWGRIAELSAASLPDRERVPGLRLLHHVVAPGNRRRDDPLISPRTRVPYAVAEPAAIAAIVGHPQGSLRYYQRAVVGMAGKDVLTPAGALITPAEHTDVAVSVFTYVAVEGAMLYAESLVTVLPPIAPEFHVVDAIAPSLRRRRAFTETFRKLPWGSVGAPVRAVGSIFQLARSRRRMDQYQTAGREQVIYSHGARLSVRELGALDAPDTFLQRLDVGKYSKLIERRSTLAIIEFLREHGVDTSEFEHRVNVVHNEGVVISGGTVTGAVAAGRGAQAQATAGRPA